MNTEINQPQSGDFSVEREKETWNVKPKKFCVRTRKAREGGKVDEWGKRMFDNERNSREIWTEVVSGCGWEEAVRLAQALIAIDQNEAVEIYEV